MAATNDLLKDRAKLAGAALKGGPLQDLYVAVTKATLADEAVPKEKHVRTLKMACSAHAPRQQVDFVIYKLGKRLNSPSWAVALKALMVFHRLCRECDPSFQEQLLRFCDRTGRPRMLCLEHFIDQTSREAWDCSAAVRAYSLFLGERLEAFRAIRFDPEGGAQAARQQQQAAAYGGPTGGYGGPMGGYGGPTGGYGGPTGGYGGPTGAYGASSGPASAIAGPTGPYGGPTGGYGAGANPGPHANGTGGQQEGGAQSQQQQQALAPSSLRDCEAGELLERLPRVQRLMLRMLACVPEGAAAAHPLCLTAAAWVLRESRAVYRAASEGVINLADKFFDMERSDAMRGLDLYKDALVLHEKLGAYYAAMQAVPPLRNAIAYPSLTPLPADFVAAMEAYAKDAPRDGTGPPTPAKKAGAGAKVAEVRVLGTADGVLLPQDADAAPAAAEPEPGAAGGVEARASEVAAPGAPASPQPEAHRPGSPVKAALMPVIDLLSFDDDHPLPAQVAPLPGPAAPAPKGELDFFADGLAPPANSAAGVPPAHSNGAAGFEPGAFDAAAAPFGAAPPQQQQQQQHPYQQQQPFGFEPSAAPAAAPYGYPGYGYAPQPAGFAPQVTGYAPQPTGYGYPGYGSPAGGAAGTALVPVGPMGMNPFMAGGAYGLSPQGAPAPFGLPAAPAAAPAGGGNPFNPFNDGAAPPAAAAAGFVGRRMEGDPLNGLTDELLGARPRPVAGGANPGPAAQPSLRDLKAGSPAPGGAVARIVANSATAPAPASAW